MLEKHIVCAEINSIAKPLAHVCSKSFECGVFPDNNNNNKFICIAP